MAESASKGFFGKKILWILLALLLVLVIIGAVLATMASKVLTADYVVAAIEEENNCRVHIGTFSKSLFGGPATVELGGVHFLPRDEFADNGTPLSERPKPTEIPLISVRSMKMSASLGDLIGGRISVNDVTVDGLVIGRLLIPKEGDNNLKPLFDPPVTVSGAPNPEFEEKQRRRDLARERKKLPREERDKLKPEESFSIDELPFPATLGSVTLSDSVINVKLQKEKTRLKFEEVRVQFSDIDLDPKDLVGHNQAKLTMTAKLTVTDNSEAEVLGKFDLEGAGDLVPFDTVTGQLNPDLVYTVTVKKGSELVRLPSLEKLDKPIKTLNSFGLKLEPINSNIVFQEDAVLNLGYSDTLLRLTDNASVKFQDHRLELLDGSHWDTSSNDHELLADLYIAEELSQRALTRARGFLKDDLKLGGEIGGDLVAVVEELVFTPLTKENRLWVPFSSKGDITDPKVKPRSEIKDLEEVIKVEAGNKAMDLLKGLLDK